MIFSWLDPDKEVYVLQNRKFRKKRSLFVSGGGGKTLSGAFVKSTQLQVRMGFFFKEEYGMGLLYSKNKGKKNTTAESVYANNSIPFHRIVEDYQGAMFLFSPFYSKANFFNQIFYYDFIIGLGYGKLNESNNRGELNNRGKLNEEEPLRTKESHNGPLMDLGLKFFITPYLSTSLNANAFYYQAKSGKKDNSKEIWYSHWDLTLSVGLTL